MREDIDRAFEEIISELRKAEQVAALCNRGLGVIALKPRSKLPAVSWKEFQTRRPTPDEVERWFAVEPERNVGILTGAVSGVVVLDIDDERGGHESITKFGPLPRTPTVRTGRGHHYYFKHIGSEVPNKVDLVPGIDVRGDGGYVVAPPSVHENGSLYTWEIGLDEAPLAPLPEWLLRLIGCRREKTDTDRGGTARSASTAYALKALSAECNALSARAKGSRNDGLNIAACKLGQLIAAGELDEQEATNRLIEACERNGLVPDDGPSSVRATIKSGFGKGMQNPRGSARDEQGSRGASAGLALVRASEIQPRRTSWLWKPVLPKGKLAMIVGDPGVAKTHVGIGTAATVSSGGPWPASTKCARPGNVVIISAEDDAADTIVPRLMAAGADLDRVYILDSVKDDNGVRLLDLNRDVGRLREQMRVIGDASLIIIDPITAYLGKADANNNGDVRNILAKLSRLAASYNTCILAISHLNKDAGKKAAYRVTGSLGFAAAARTVYVIVKDADDPDRRIMAPLKNNLATDTIGFAFTVEPTCLAGGIETSRVIFEDMAHHATADEVLIENSESGQALNEAKDFLQAMLNDGPVEANEIKEEARSAGICERTLRRAKAKLEVGSSKRDNKWYWEAR